jgi:LysW-gamma-L-lysine carboxypeptidase
MRSWGKKKLQEYAVDLLKNMVKIYSPTGKEERLARFLLEEMKGLGFDVRQDAVGNVIGEFGEGSPIVLLCGHIDTVPPELPVKVEKGVLYGRGAVDAKGPLAALIIAASLMKGTDYKGRLIVIGAVDEEGKNRGIKNIIDEGLEADYAIFGEPTNVDTITMGYRGGLLLKVICKTETGHSSAPWLFQNSIEKAMEIWNLIKSLELQEKEQESRFHSTSYCLRKIRGGGESSIVPSRCEALIEARIPPSITVEEQSEKMLNVIKSYNEENPSVKIDTEVLDYVKQENLTSSRPFPLNMEREKSACQAS